MKAEDVAHITRRLRDKARDKCPPKFPVERMIESIAADALDAQAAEIEDMRKAFEAVFSAEDGFTEAFDDLVTAGLLVEVPSDEAFREWWGDEPTMWVWRWHPLATPSTPKETSR